jgi:hypothetical protein
MAHTIHTARITGPVSYSAQNGTTAVIPLGPCLVEQIDGRSVDILWGERGDQTAAIPFEALEAAEDRGHLIVLD